MTEPSEVKIQRNREACIYIYAYIYKMHNICVYIYIMLSLMKKWIVIEGCD